MTELTSMSLVEAAAAVRTGKTTAVALLEACLERIEETEPIVSAFASLQADEALATATELDRHDPVGPLHGVPIALKDLFFTRGVPTEANCDALAGFAPERDASVVTRLRAGGAVIVGKTNTHELAYGVSCPASYNPWNPDRMTGGSSGGNAAALAARQVFGALGTDTGGSVRIPSNYCGTTAIKTTRGAVPRDGVHLISWTYDTVGPMARKAADCLALLELIAGESSLDPFSSRLTLTPAVAPSELVLGVPDESFFEGFETDTEVRAVMEEAVDVLGSIVSEVKTVAVPNTVEHFESGAAIVFAESAALLKELRATSNDRIGEEARAIMTDGAAIPGTVFAEAQARRVAFERAYQNVFEDQGVQLFIAPVNPNQVLPHGTNDIGGVPLIPATTQFTFPVNGAGLPAISLPGGFAEDGMPIGFQLVGRCFDERTLAVVGEAFQGATDHHERSPARLTGAQRLP